MESHAFDQDQIIINYNKLAEAYKKRGINLVKLNTEGECNGLTLNFLLYAKDFDKKGKRGDFYRHIELISSLTDKSIEQILDSKNETFTFKASFDKEPQKIDKESFLSFIKIMSSIQKKVHFKCIHANWDKNCLVSCHLNELAGRLKKLNIQEGQLIYASLGVHAFGIIKIKGKFRVFEPNFIKKRGSQLSEVELAKSIIENQSLLINNQHIALNLYFLSYGDTHAEILKLISEFKDIISQEQREGDFSSELSLITDYEKGNLSRQELEFALSDLLSQHSDLPDRLINYKEKLTLIKNSMETTPNQLDNINFKNSAYFYNITSLYLAVQANQITMVKDLLHRGADPNPVKDGGITPLYLAAQDGHLECMNALLAHPTINPNLSVHDYGTTPLLITVAKNHFDCFKALLAHNKVNPNLRATKDGATTLYYAVQEGRLEYVNTLLAHPTIDPNLVCNGNGFSPLIIALVNGHADCFNALLAHPKINVNQTNKMNGTTALHYAAATGNLKCLNALLAHQANVNQVGNNGDTPLFVAAQAGYLDCVSKLLQHGANCHIPIKFPMNILLQTAEEKGRKTLVKELLPKPFFLFSLFEKDSSQKLENFNALHAAAFFGHVEVVKHLLDNGADIFSEAQGKLTALDFAQAMGHQEIVTLLKERSLLQKTSSIKKPRSNN